ncbi:MAG: hypothetical protein JO189_33870 [Deltaproteobacteria bacterium]|nr:hypothetical protein [Deltaproteobacteria bacterium]
MVNALTILPFLTTWFFFVGLIQKPVGTPKFITPFPAMLCPREQSAPKELSTRTELLAIQAQYPNWKIATFTAVDARKAGYILMRDLNDSTHILLYDKNNPDRRAGASITQTLANAARII